MEQTEPREGDEVVWDELTRRAGGYGLAVSGGRVRSPDIECVCGLSRAPLTRSDAGTVKPPRAGPCRRPSVDV